MNWLKPWHWAIIVLIGVLWLVTLLTTFIAIWVGPWQMTATAFVLFLLAFCASFLSIPVMDDIERERKRR